MRKIFIDALDFLLKKSKDLQERLENNMISKEFFENSTFKNKHFLIGKIKKYS